MTAQTQTQTTVLVNHLTTADNKYLYHRYPGEAQPQTCYVSLDCRDGELTVDWDAEIGLAVPASVWYGHVIRWGIPCLTTRAANQLLDHLAALAQTVVDGYTSVYDGQNYVGRYTIDAQDAIDRIRELCDDNDDPDAIIRAVEAQDWYQSGEVDAVARPGMTAGEIEEAAKELDEKSIDNGGVDIIEGTAKMLADAVEALSSAA